MHPFSSKLDFNFNAGYEKPLQVFISTFSFKQPQAFSWLIWEWHHPHPLPLGSEFELHCVFWGTRGLFCDPPEGHRSPLLREGHLLDPSCLLKKALTTWSWLASTLWVKFWFRAGVSDLGPRATWFCTARWLWMIFAFKKIFNSKE